MTAAAYITGYVCDIVKSAYPVLLPAAALTAKHKIHNTTSENTVLIYCAAASALFHSGCGKFCRAYTVSVLY